MASPSRVEIGDSVLHYRVERMLGAGGMGCVFKAFDTRLERPVAIKVLRTDLGHDEEQRQRFLREARVVASLYNSHIVMVHEIATVNGTDFLVMEYVDGETLSTRLRREALDADESLRISLAIAEGLKCAHEAGVVHRDLKPGNVILGRDGSVKILDFGLAKLRQPARPHGDETVTAPLTIAGAVLGTPAYMSPEQVRGEEADVRSDLFSLGILMYEVVKGKRPFDGPTLPDILSNLLRVEPEPLPDGPMTAIIERCLVKDREMRLGSASELVELLQQAQAGDWRPAAPVKPEPAVTTERTHRGWKPGFWAVVVIASVALLGISWTRPEVRGWLQGRAVSAGLSAPVPPAVMALREGRAFLDRYDRKGYLDKAVERFEKALQLDRDLVLARAGLSEAYMQVYERKPDNHWLKLALVQAEEVVKRSPELATGHVRMGAVLAASGKPDDARKEFNRALEIDSKSVEGHYTFARFLGVKEAPDAEKHYLKAIELAPQYWLAKLSLGLLYGRLSRYDEAAKSIEGALEIAPDCSIALTNLSAIYHFLGRTDDAVSVTQRALELDPSSVLYTNLGTLRFFQARYDESATAFEKSIQMGANSYLHWGNLGDAYRWSTARKSEAAGAYDTAIRLTREWLAKRPDDTRAGSSLAVYLAKKGEPQAAISAAKSIDLKNEKQGSVAFKVAIAYEIAGSREQAIDAMKRAIQLDYARKEIELEPELIALRSDPRYQRLLQ